MRHLSATVLDTDRPWPFVHRLRLHVPGLEPLAAGQFVLAAVPGRRDPLLPIPLLPSGQDRSAETIETLFVTPGDATAQPADWHPGSQLTIIGPAGRPFVVDSRTRRALLVADGSGIGPLVLFARSLVERDLEVTFVAMPTLDGVTMPGNVLPHEVEYVVPPAAPGAGPSDSMAAIEPLLSWADQLFVALPEALLPAVLNLMRRRLLRLRKGFAQALVAPGVLPCGIGACDLCVIRTRDGFRRRCRDGLTFDLLGLI